MSVLTACLGQCLPMLKILKNRQLKQVLTACLGQCLPIYRKSLSQTTRSPNGLSRPVSSDIL